MMTFPTFIIAGVKKAATTSMYEYMKQHPQVFMPHIKETKFFLYDPTNPDHVEAGLNIFPIRSLDEYTALFADANGARAIGEASPGYIDSLQTARRVADLLPRVKLIFSLRNPVERAYSNYLMRVRSGYEKRPVLEAFRQERKRLQARSYSVLLEEWYAHFPESQIYLLLFEEFKRNQVAAMQKLYRFVDVDDQFTPDTSVQHNVGGAAKHQWLQSLIVWARSYRYLRFYIPKGLRSQFSKLARANLAPPPPMPPDVRALLTEVYAEDAKQLQARFHLDLSAWRLTNAQVDRRAQPDVPKAL